MATKAEMEKSLAERNAHAPKPAQKSRRRAASSRAREETRQATSGRPAGQTTARRNIKNHKDSGVAYALEDSATGKPSRKSTRRSANRLKAGTQLTRQAKRAVRSPKQRAARSAAERT